VIRPLPAAIVLPVAATLAACSQPATVEAPLPCPDSRGQVCTTEYRPVCGFDGNNGRTQYSNACSACSNPGVRGYLPGPCADIPPPD